MASIVGGAVKGAGAGSALGPIGAVAGGVFGALGGIFGNKSQKKKERQARQAAEAARTSFAPISGTGGTGVGVNIQGEGGDISGFDFDLGALAPAQAGLQGLAGGLDLSSLQQFAQLAGQGGALGQGGIEQLLQSFGNLNPLQQATGQAFGGAAADVFGRQQDPFAQGLSQSLLGQAAGAFGDVATTGQQAFDRTLGTLREQAQPFEERAFSGLQENLFGTGRLGTTGGALQTEAFARGLGQADLQRVLSAQGESRAAQTQAQGLGQGFLGAGSGIQSLQDSLLSGAVNRFGSLGQFSQGLSKDRFNRGGQLLQTGGQLAQVPLNFQTSALGNLGTLGDFGAQSFDQALALMKGQANAATGQAQSLGQTLGTAGAGTAANAALFSQLGGIAQNQFGSLGDLFGGSPALQQRAQPGSDALAAIAAGVS